MVQTLALFKVLWYTLIPVFLAILFAVEFIFNPENTVLIALIITVALEIFIPLLISIIRWRLAIRRTDKYNDDISKLNYQIDIENAELKKQYELDCEYANKETEQAHIQAKIIMNEATEVRKKASELKQLRQKYYSIGIIPPDYRTMDCVYVFDQIFRNDLADNMRQAVALYEERAFRGEIIRGMGTIISKLDSLQGTMSDLVSDIYSVKQNVSFMSQDVFRMAEAQSKHNDKMLENSKATRYAAETVQKYSEQAKKHFGF